MGCVKPSDTYTCNYQGRGTAMLPCSHPSTSLETIDLKSEIASQFFKLFAILVLKKLNNFPFNFLPILYCLIEMQTIKEIFIVHDLLKQLFVRVSVKTRTFFQ